MCSRLKSDREIGGTLKFPGVAAPLVRVKAQMAATLFTTTSTKVTSLFEVQGEKACVLFHEPVI